jgi:hypothetical protein
MRVCEICGRELVKNKRFCSRQCYAKWQSENIKGASHPNWTGGDTQTCEHCGSEFRLPPWRARKGMGTGRFCSRACYGQYRKERTGITQECVWCGESFRATRYRVARGRGRFCSRICKDKWWSASQQGSNCTFWKGGLITTVCLWCGKEFKAKPSWLAAGKAKFCSRACYGHWQSENRVGKRAANWRGGLAVYSYPPAFNSSLKQRVRGRDGYACAICKMPEHDYAHHIHHIDYDKQNNSLANLLELCHNCHVKTNGNRDYWQRVLTPLPLLHEQFLSVRREVRK